MRRRPLFRLRDMRGVIQLAPRYLLVLAIVAGIAGYFVGLATAPTVRPSHDLPGWFQPYFIGVAAVIGAVGTVLILQVNVPALELSPRNAAVVYLWLTLGLLAAIAGATTAPSRGWYAQLLALSDLGGLTAVVAMFVCGLKKLSADGRRIRRAWGDSLRGRKPPAGPSG